MGPPAAVFDRKRLAAVCGLFIFLFYALPHSAYHDSEYKGICDILNVHSSLSPRGRGTAVVRDVCLVDGQFRFVVSESEKKDALTWLARFFAPPRVARLLWLFRMQSWGKSGYWPTEAGEMFLTPAEITDMVAPGCRIQEVQGLTLSLEQRYAGKNLALYGEKALTMLTLLREKSPEKLSGLPVVDHPVSVLSLNRVEGAGDYEYGTWERGVLAVLLAAAGVADAHNASIVAPDPLGMALTATYYGSARVYDGRVADFTRSNPDSDVATSKAGALCFESMLLQPHVNVEYLDAAGSASLRADTAVSLGVPVPRAAGNAGGAGSGGAGVEGIRVTVLVRKTNRRVLNHGDLLNILAALGVKNVREVEWTGATFEEQVTDMFNTDLLIGMHGAGLQNLLFLPSGAHILEMFPYSIGWYRQTQLSLGYSVFGKAWDALDGGLYMRYRIMARSAGLNHWPIFTSPPLPTDEAAVVDERPGYASDKDSRLSPADLSALESAVRGALGALIPGGEAALPSTRVHPSVDGGWFAVLVFGVSLLGVTMVLKMNRSARKRKL